MALCHGGYRTVVITNRQLVFLREYEGERALCAVNLDDAPSTANLGGFAGRATDLISGEMVELAQNQILEPCSAKIWRLG